VLDALIDLGDRRSTDLSRLRHSGAFRACPQHRPKIGCVSWFVFDAGKSKVPPALACKFLVEPVQRVAGRPHLSSSG
jgi:hypothetical protein